MNIKATGGSMAVALFLFFMPSAADAFVRSMVPGSDACLYWGTREIVYYINERGATEVTDGSDIDAAIASFEAWSEPQCSDLTFVFGGLTDRVDVGYVEGAWDNKNLVVFRDALCSEVVASDDPCWDCYDHGGECCPTAHDCWGHAPGAIAITTTTFHRSTGLLVDADIELNEARYILTTSDGPPCEDGPGLSSCETDSDCAPHQACMRGRCRTRGCVHTDIANTLTHEVGHVIGLDHTPEPEATMYASASLGETKKRELHEVDIRGLCEIYPAGEPTVTCLGDAIHIEPIGVVDATPGCLGCSSGGDGRLPALLLLAVAIVMLSPRRARCSSSPCESGEVFCSLSPLVLAALLWGGAPGELETRLGRGAGVIVAEAVDPAEPCGSSTRPAVVRVSVKDVMSGALSTGEAEVLVVPGGGGIPEGESSLVVLRRVTVEDGAGCATVPSHSVDLALSGLDLSGPARDAWRGYLDRVRALPPGGVALERGRAALWSEAVALDEIAISRHAAHSLQAYSKEHGLTPEVVGRLVGVLLNSQIAAESRSLAASVLGRVVAPRHRGRHLFEGDDRGADEARAALMRLLEDSDPKLRRQAVLSLAPLVSAGDRTVTNSLERLLESEDCPEVLSLLEEVVPSGGAGGRGADDEYAKRRLGQRMLLVLFGLLALLGMALLPAIQRRFVGPSGARDEG